MSALLEVTDVRKSFGFVHAVQGVDLTVPEGSITALIGPNGSGKTTLFNAITGYQSPDGGRINFAGQDVTGHTPGRLYRRGLSRTFQQARIFGDLSVLENLVLAGGPSVAQVFGRRVSAGDRRQATELLEEFGMAQVAELRAGELSYGQRKLLEFASVLMTGPQLVLLDEPTAGVNGVMIDTMERHIRERNARGVTFLIVEHDLNFVMRLCDPVIVLDQGRTIFVGDPAELHRDQRVLDAYLGD